MTRQNHMTQDLQRSLQMNQAMPMHGNPYQKQDHENEGVPNQERQYEQGIPDQEDQ